MRSVIQCPECKCIDQIHYVDSCSVPLIVDIDNDNEPAWDWSWAEMFGNHGFYTCNNCSKVWRGKTGEFFAAQVEETA
jgi:hypothetical protein